MACNATKHCEVSTSSSTLQKYQTVQSLRGLSSVTDETFSIVSYNSTTTYTNDHSNWIKQGYHYPDQDYLRESGMLQSMNMLVSLQSPEAASCSLTDTFEYTPLHVQDPIILSIPSPSLHYQISSPILADLSNKLIPEHVKKGIWYEDSDIVKFRPQVSQ